MKQVKQIRQKQAVTAVRVNRVPDSDPETLRKLILVQESQIAALKREMEQKTAVVSTCRAIIGDVLMVKTIDPDTGEILDGIELFGGSHVGVS